MNNSDNMVIALLEHREEYQAIYGMNLALYLGANVKVSNTIKALTDLIDKHKPELVFVNNDAYSQDVAFEIWKVFEKKMLKIPLFVLGVSKVPSDQVTVFDSNIQLRDVLRSIAKEMKITAEMMAKREYPEYFLLPSDFLIPGWQTALDIFVRKEGKFEVAFEVEDIITGDELTSLEQDGKLELYVKKDERLKFVNSVTNQISAKLNDPNLSPEERVELTATGYQMVMEQARKIGISEGTMEISNSCIESMNKSIALIPKLDDFLQLLLSDSSSLRYKHSLLINFIGSHIIKKTPWGNKDQQDKFAFVSFFHNIALSKDEYVLITSDQQLKASNLSDEEKKLIENHALIAAKLVSGVDGIPFGAPTLIKQHHGSNKGIGLSALFLNISPLAIVFIFAQEWANLVFKFENSKDRPSKQDVIKILHKKYNKPGFNKLLPILHTLDF